MWRPWRGSVGVGISCLFFFQSGLCCGKNKSNSSRGTNQCQLNLDLVCCILPETDEVSVNVSPSYITKQNTIQDVSVCFLFLVTILLKGK